MTSTIHSIHAHINFLVVVEKKIKKVCPQEKKKCLAEHAPGVKMSKKISRYLRQINVLLVVISTVCMLLVGFSHLVVFEIRLNESLKKKKSG